jgi:peptidoglycan/LPS O-acetylase OafA/YrhL
VDLFFVLSGFLISSQLFAQWKESGVFRIRDFFLKRFFRILPAFWVVVAIYFCVPFFHEKEQLRPLWRYLTFTQNFGLDVFNFGTFSHAWSLCVEEHFYLILPFTLLLLTGLRIFKRSFWLLIVLFAATIFLRYYSYRTYYEPFTGQDGAGIKWYTYVYYPSYCRLDGLLTGVGIAAMYTFLPKLWESMARYGNVMFLLSILVLTGGYHLCYDEHSFYASVFGFAVVSVGYGLMVVAALSRSCFLFKLKSRVTAVIALLSYAVYLTHKGVIHVTQEWLGNIGMDVDSGQCMAICALTCIIAAAILHFVVEKPFMMLRKKVLNRDFGRFKD